MRGRGRLRSSLGVGGERLIQRGGDGDRGGGRLRRGGGGGGGAETLEEGD